jgi:hypothetical protein
MLASSASAEVCRKSGLGAVQGANKHRNVREEDSLGSGDAGKDVGSEQNVSKLQSQAWRTVSTVFICLSKIVGKYVAYPSVDGPTAERIDSVLTQGLSRRAPAEVGDFCQELRAVSNCPISELIRPKGADETDTRITAFAQVVRSYASLNDADFKEILTALLSWSPPDKTVILSTLVGIVRGA